MRRIALRTALYMLVSILALFGFATGTSWACTNAQTCSTSYQVNEAFFGTGASLDSTCSTSYCAQQSAGETGVGNSSSASYQAQAGYNTAREPSLTLVVNDSNCSDYHAGGVNINLGYLSSSVATTGSANFSAKSYLTSGYVVTTVGAPPTSNGPSPHTLSNLTFGTASTPGTEQFGINLVSNTTPIVGANPTQVPAGFGFGIGAANYHTHNIFIYNNGDAIAQSTSSSGTTCYDISYLFNISGTTPAGVYTMKQAVVATSTF